jgi:hypothetical protein
LNSLTVDTRTAEEGKGKCKKVRVEECVDWLENGHVLDENRVPKEADDEHINEEDEEKNDEPLEKAGEAGNVNKVTNHL